MISSIFILQYLYKILAIRLAFIFGAAGGPLAYLAGSKLGGVTFHDPVMALTALALGWAIITPVLVQAAQRLNRRSSDGRGWGLATVITRLDMTAFLDGLGRILAAGLVTWAISLAKRDVSIIDSLWSLLFVLAAGLYLATAPAPGSTSILVLMLVGLWAFRLAVYITWRNWGADVDLNRLMGDW